MKSPEFISHYRKDSYIPRLLNIIASCVTNTMFNIPRCWRLFPKPIPNDSYSTISASNGKRHLFHVYSVHSNSSVNLYVCSPVQNWLSNGFLIIMHLWIVNLPVFKQIFDFRVNKNHILTFIRYYMPRLILFCKFRESIVFLTIFFNLIMKWLSCLLFNVYLYFKYLHVRTHYKRYWLKIKH